MDEAGEEDISNGVCLVDHDYYVKDIEPPELDDSVTATTFTDEEVPGEVVIEEEHQTNLENISENRVITERVEDTEVENITIPLNPVEITAKPNLDNISLKPQTFVFKKNKNLGLLIKTALKQCNFPRGTRLVRSIDFTEKGKSMYRIELPSELDRKKYVKRLKVKKTNAISKNAGDNSSNQTTQKTRTPMVIHESENNKENQVDNIAIAKIFRNDGDKSSENVAASDDDGSNSSVEMEDTVPREPSSVHSDVTKRTHFKVPGINGLQKSIVWKRVYNEILKKMKRQSRNIQTYKNKLKLARLKERLKSATLNELNDACYVMDEEAIVKALDKLYYQGKINPLASRLVFLVHKLADIKPGGRRFSVEDKLFSFGLYRSLGKANYHALEKVLPIPSRNSMLDMVNRAPFSPGVNQQVFENLRKSVLKLNHEEKLCSLMFDEISIAQDKLPPDEDTNNATQKKPQRRRQNIDKADHVMVFMLRGLVRNWKQPVAYLVYNGELDVVDLVRNIREALKMTLGIGLKPVATVFNKKNSFSEAISYLRVETDIHCINLGIDNSHFGFLVDSNEIVPLFNSTQLFKETKDTLMDYDIEYEQDGRKKVASWDHLKLLYSVDVGSDSIKVCPRLNEKNIRKKSQCLTENCSPIFSQRVSAVMRKLATLSADGIDNKASETADFLLLIDQLLDSCNSGHISSKLPPISKPLKLPVDKASLHELFWTQAIETITSFKYLLQDNNPVVLSLTDNWISNLLGYIYLTNNLLNQGGIKSIPMRNLTCEPLDEFFESIRCEKKSKTPNYNSFFIAFRTFVFANQYFCNNCFLNDKNDLETPLDVNRNYVYDEISLEEDIQCSCCVHGGQSECSSVTIE